PRGDVILGGFEDWSGVMGGILTNAWMDGFLTNRAAFRAAKATPVMAQRWFVNAWWTRYGTDRVTVAELYELAKHPDCALDISASSGQASKIRLGRILGSLVGEEQKLYTEATVVVQYAGVVSGHLHWRLACA